MPGNVPFVVSDELDGEAKVFRVFHAASLRVPDVLRRIRVLLDQASQDRTLSRWLAAGQLGFAVLAPIVASKAALEKSVAKSGLTQAYRLIVDLGPDADNLASALKASP